MPVTIHCKRCGKGFSVKPNQVNKRVYCSKECMSEAYKGERRLLICESCGKEFEVPNRPSRENAKFCSKKCMGIGKSGESHWNYQHGLGDKSDKQKESRRKYRQINKDRIMKRAFLHKAKARTSFKVKGGHTFEEWEQLVNTSEGKCFYCGVETTREEGKRMLTRDHIVPLSRGGTDDISNVVVCCKSCNGSKGDKTLEEWKRVTVIERTS